MRQVQIDSTQAKPEEDMFAEFAAPKAGSAQYIDINGPVSPAVLSGLLDCNVQMVYQYRQDGKLPPNSDASYRDCIKHHLTFYKTKATSKASSLADAALVEKIQLDRARREQTWLAIKKERGELADTKMLAETFEPYFLQMRMQLVSLTRKHPEIQDKVDKIIAHWNELGAKLLQKSSEELDNFIELQMQKEIELEVPDAE